jgi:hypothetical protein
MDDIRSAITKAMAYNRIRLYCKNLKRTTMPVKQD